MHPVRRRKKRPNYGVRTVEVKRGQNGFGFTISGQHPCILSCIVAGSPAETAGLRAGDYLVAVEGQSVRKVPHDDVVRLIGGSTGILRLQIAENYYSDSSEDEVLAATARQKPKYPHKSRLTGRHPAVSPHSRAAKVVRDLRTGAMFEEPLNYAQTQSQSQSQSQSPSRSSTNPLPDEWNVPPPSARFHLPSAIELGNRPLLEAEIFRVVVGYVGTIEMPRKLPPGSRLQIVRGCIKRLRAEKRAHTPVLMTVMTRSLRLTNGAGITLAVYPGERVTFCGSSSDKDHKHFGIVTTATGEDPSSSCHIFAVDARPHCNHLKRAKIFKLECQVDPSSGACKEFPTTCEPIIAIIKGFYESSNMNNMDEPVVANSPQPSNDSTTTTSNSDSGIGFRDDCGNQSDRILVVDVQNHRLHIQEVDKGGNWTDNKITVRSHPNIVATSSRSRSPLSTGSEGPGFLEDMSVSSEATKSPDVTIVHKGHKAFNGLENCTESVDNVSIISLRSHDTMSINYKLSPKVFTLPPLASQSLEDLKDSHSEDGLPRNQQQSGSLQDLRTFSTDNCFERCSASLVMHKDEDKGVSAWAASFEKLLEDQFGLHVFAEFLKKEFSHENIYFWVACEKYNKINEPCERKLQAQTIFERHLALGAPEPVNVDFYARQVTQVQLEEAAPSLFSQAQKQIFNLMKYDSYPRFIKSDLYKECVVRDLAGEELPVHDSHPDLTLKPSPAHSKLKKSKSNADDRRRKSLLPWSRKARTKSHDRVSFDHDDSSISSSRSSLANWDVPLSSGLCRVVLPDGSTAVVHSRNSQSVRHLISRLLDKRGLSYTDFLVVHSYLNKTIPLDEDAILLSGQEVRVERRVVFRLDLPNRKTIAIKSKPCKTLSQVLRPILHKYGYRLEMVTLCLMSENEVLEPDLAVTMVDNQRIQVLTRNTPTESLSQTGSWRADECSSKGKSLDEITNRVFEELLQVKAENRNDLVTASEPGSIRSEDLGSESSSGILGRFLRRDSALIDKNRKNKKAMKMEDNDRKSTLSKLPPLIAKLKPSSKFESRSENDGLKRAQRSRLEDQRGTEINFELPDFLKDKENTPQVGNKLSQAKTDLDESLPRNFSIEPRVTNPLESCVKTYSTGDLTRTSVEDLLSIYNTTRPSPPPLPPKPKKIPCAPTFAQPTDNRPRPRTRRAVYLDQPSSSFV